MKRMFGTAKLIMGRTYVVNGQMFPLDTPVGVFDAEVWKRVKDNPWFQSEATPEPGVQPSVAQATQDAHPAPIPIPVHQEPQPTAPAAKEPPVTKEMPVVTPVNKPAAGGKKPVAKKGR